MPSSARAPGGRWTPGRRTQSCCLESSERAPASPRGSSPTCWGGSAVRPAVGAGVLGRAARLAATQPRARRGMAPRRRRSGHRRDDLARGPGLLGGAPPRARGLCPRCDPALQRSLRIGAGAVARGRVGGRAVAHGPTAASGSPGHVARRRAALARCSAAPRSCRGRGPAHRRNDPLREPRAARLLADRASACFLTTIPGVPSRTTRSRSFHRRLVDVHVTDARLGLGLHRCPAGYVTTGPTPA